MAVISGSRAEGCKESSSIAMRCQITAPAHRVFASDFAESLEVIDEAHGVRIDDGIGAIRRDDSAFPAALANLYVMAQIIERRFGRRECFDVEAFEQCTRTKLRLLQ